MVDYEQAKKYIRKVSLNAGYIDKEFYSLETGILSAPEKAFMTRQFLAHLDEPESEFGPYLADELSDAGPEEGISFWKLSDAGGGRMEWSESGERRFRKTEHHNFIDVGINDMWAVAKTKNPYMRAKIHTGCAIAGVAFDRLFLVSIEMPTEDAIRKSVDFLEDKGIVMEGMFVMADLGPVTQEKALEAGVHIESTKEGYEKLNFEADKIFAFNHEIDSDEGTHRNVGGMILTRRFIYKYDFNLADPDPRGPEVSIHDEDIVTLT